MPAKILDARGLVSIVSARRASPESRVIAVIAEIAEIGKAKASTRREGVIGGCFSEIPSGARDHYGYETLKVLVRFKCKICVPWKASWV
jgi:hypothetical protein